MTASADAAISTPLLIAAEERATADSFAVYDPAADGAIVGYAAATETHVMSVPA